MRVSVGQRRLATVRVSQDLASGALVGRHSALLLKHQQLVNCLWILPIGEPLLELELILQKLLLNAEEVGGALPAIKEV